MNTTPFTPQMLREQAERIDSKTERLCHEAQELGAGIRFLQFPLTLGWVLEAVPPRAWRIHRPDGATYEALLALYWDLGCNAHRYPSGALQTLLTLCQRRPVRLKEFTSNLRAVEQWLDRRLLGLKKFERDLHRVQPLPMWGRRFHHQ